MRKPHPQSPWLRVDLTDRQREILDLFNAGLSQTEIARRLGIAQSTVKQHLSYALAKGIRMEQERAWRERHRAEAAV